MQVDKKLESEMNRLMKIKEKKEEEMLRIKHEIEEGYKLL